MLEVKNLCKEFNNRPILKDISFTLKDGEIMTIVGPSGAGKTTLLRIIAGLETKDSGEILIDGKPYDSGKVGVVFQDFNLFPNLNVLQNITLAPTAVLKESKEEADKNAQELLNKLQMQGREKQYPYELSGGQKQRVAIARALAMKPRILCYDEPTSALDPNLRKEVEKMILNLKKSGLTQLIITHDLTFAENVADQMLKVEPLSEAQFMKKKWIFALLAVLMLVLTGCESVQQRSNTEDTWNKIARKKQVVIGLDDSFVPMGFEKKDGQLTGYDVDLAKEVFKLYGINVSFQTIDWSMNVTELRNGTIDLLWNGYSITPERKKKVAFSKPYLRNRQVLVVKKNSGIDSFKQMKKYELGMQTGSTAEQWYEGKQNVLRAKKTVLYDTISNSFLDLNAGRIQEILLDEVYANYYIAHMAKSKDYKVIQNDDVPMDLFAVGMRKGDKTLRRKVNQGLEKLQKNGKLKQLNEKWFDKDSNYLGK